MKLTNLVILATLVTLTACGDVNINGNKAVIGGKKGETGSPVELMAGPCGLWEIVHYYNGATFSGRCEMIIEAGTTIQVKDPTNNDELVDTLLTEDKVMQIGEYEYPYLDDDFYMSQGVYFENVIGEDSEYCDIQLYDSKLTMDCGTFYFETSVLE